MELSQIYKQPNIKTICNDVSLLTTIDLLEVELSSRALEEEEERRRHKAAGVAVASFTSTGSGSGKGSTKPICRDFLTENGCSKGGQYLRVLRNKLLEQRLSQSLILRRRLLQSPRAKERQSLKPQLHHPLLLKRCMS